MAHISLYAPETNWFVTDLPMYAFRHRLAIPPELAVFSLKRLETGEITAQDVIDVIEKYQPEQVLIGRFDLPELKQYLEDQYIDVYDRGNMVLYIRSDIERIPIGSIEP